MGFPIVTERQISCCQGRKGRSSTAESILRYETLQARAG
jgi:hypothetical protein